MNSLSDPEHKILHHPERLAAFKHGIAYPISAEIDLTWRCALNCKGCHSKHLHQGIELSEFQITRVLSQLQLYGCQSVTFSGGGDPFESPYWRFAINLAQDLGMSVAAYSYLPGLNQEMVDFLGQKLAFVYTHSCNTKGLIRRKDKNTVWTYGWLLDADNWHKVPDMVMRTDLDFFNFVDFRPLAPENKVNPSTLDYSWIPNAIRLLKSAGKINSQVKWASYKFSSLLRPDFGRDYPSCLSTHFTTVVGPDGAMWECTNRRGFADSFLGNLLKEDLESIWKRKPKSRENLTDCRIICRNNSLNQTLYHKVLGPSPVHAEFI